MTKVNLSGRAVRVHPVRLLLDLVPVVLVEHGPVPGPRRADAGLQVDHRLPRPAAGGQARQAEGPLLSLQASGWRMSYKIPYSEKSKLRMD